MCREPPGRAAGACGTQGAGRTEGTRGPQGVAAVQTRRPPGFLLLPFLLFCEPKRLDTQSLKQWSAWRGPAATTSPPDSVRAGRCSRGTGTTRLRATILRARRPRPTSEPTWGLRKYAQLGAVLPPQADGTRDRSRSGGATEAAPRGSGTRAEGRQPCSDPAGSRHERAVWVPFCGPHAGAGLQPWAQAGHAAALSKHSDRRESEAQSRVLEEPPLPRAHTDQRLTPLEAPCGAGGGTGASLSGDVRALHAARCWRPLASRLEGLFPGSPGHLLHQSEALQVGEGPSARPGAGGTGTGRTQGRAAVRILHTERRARGSPSAAVPPEHGGATGLRLPPRSRKPHMGTLGLSSEWHGWTNVGACAIQDPHAGQEGHGTGLRFRTQKGVAKVPAIVPWPRLTLQPQGPRQRTQQRGRAGHPDEVSANHS